MPTYLAIDIGTTNIKAMAVTDDGMLAEASVATPWTSRKGLRVLDPRGLIETTISVVRKGLNQLGFVAEHVTALGVTSMGEVGLFVTPEGPLGYIGAWQDLSPTEEAYRDLLSTWDAQDLFERTGMVPGPKFGLLRMRAESQLQQPDACWLSVADFIVWHLTGGECVTQTSLAARTMAYRWQEAEWDDELLTWAQLRRVHMPRVITQPVSVGQVRVSDDRRLIGAEVVNAGHDHIVGAYGASLQVGELMDSTGTAEPLVIRSPRPILSPEARTLGVMWSQGLFDHDNYVVLLPTPGGGAPEAWARHILGISWNDLRDVGTTRDTHVSFDVQGWLEGNASWHGLGYESSRFDLYWAVLNGVATSLSARIGDMEHLMQRRYTDLKVVGGIAKHYLWLAVRERVLQREQLLMEPNNAALIGAINGAARAVEQHCPIIATWQPLSITSVREA